MLVAIISIGQKDGRSRGHTSIASGSGMEGLSSSLRTHIIERSEGASPGDSKPGDAHISLAMVPYP